MSEQIGAVRSQYVGPLASSPPTRDVNTYCIRQTKICLDHFFGMNIHVATIFDFHRYRGSSFLIRAQLASTTLHFRPLLSFVLWFLPSVHLCFASLRVLRAAKQQLTGRMPSRLRNIFQETSFSVGTHLQFLCYFEVLSSGLAGSWERHAGLHVW